MLKKFITGSTLILLSCFAQIANSNEGSITSGLDNSLLSLGIGSNTGGVFLKSNLLSNEVKGNTLDVGLGYNIDIKSLQLSPSVKSVFTRYEEATDGTSLSLGIGAKTRYRFNSHWSIYSQYHYAAECFSSKYPNTYHEISSGIIYTPDSIFSLDLGYRYVRLNNNSPSKSYAANEYLAKSPYLGVLIKF
ncbi:YfaZ family outer membrane protein [Candidatus Pantoea edessiphila]|nr:YfaZ family outer membrane protein [Candidatus Pantoea edessiphila]